MKSKLLIPLLLSVIVLSACADIPPVKEPVPVDRQNTVTASEDGWTAEKLMSMTYFNGIELCYPLTLRDLGSGYTIEYSWEDDFGIRTHYLVEDTFSFDAYAYITFEHNNEIISADDEMKTLGVYHDNISVNGLKLSDPEADVESILGTPDRIDESIKFSKVYIYCDKKTGEDLLRVVVSPNDKAVTGFVFLLK